MHSRCGLLHRVLIFVKPDRAIFPDRVCRAGRARLRLPYTSGIYDRLLSLAERKLQVRVADKQKIRSRHGEFLPPFSNVLAAIGVQGIRGHSMTRSTGHAGPSGSAEGPRDSFCASHSTRNLCICGSLPRRCGTPANTADRGQTPPRHRGSRAPPKSPTFGRIRSLPPAAGHNSPSLRAPTIRRSGSGAPLAPQNFREYRKRWQFSEFLWEETVLRCSSGPYFESFAKSSLVFSFSLYFPALSHNHYRTMRVAKHLLGS